MNETVGGRRIDCLNNFPNFVDVDLVWKLSPENYSGGGKVAPDRACRFHAREFWHLDVEDADVWFFPEREFHCLFAVVSFEDGSM